MLLKSTNHHVGTNSQLTIRPAKFTDTREIALILAQSFYDFPDYLAWMYSLLQFTISEDLRYRLRSAAPLYCCLVATYPHLQGESAIAGTAEITLRTPSFWSNNVQYPYISNLAVSKNYRRRGIGSQLLTKCEQIALDWGYQETRLHVLDKNNSAKKLYNRNGYEICQIEPNWGQFLLDYSPRLLLKKQMESS